MRLFRWLSASNIPPQYDLRRCGWLLANGNGRDARAIAEPILVDGEGLGASRMEKLLAYPAQALSKLVLLGIGNAEERAKLLRSGFGDVLGLGAQLAEIEARAARVADMAASLPRSREIGRLRLDLIARDGFVDERALGLHPREFELIWHLAETPGLPVGRTELMNEVWRMTHVPDTNSVAVHIFRLRAKLGIAGLVGIVQTAPSGGYFLAPPSAIPLAATSLLPGDELVDRQARPGDKRAAARLPRSHDHEA